MSGFARFACKHAVELKKRIVRILGIVNITRDSFSDGGQFLDPLRAIEHARALMAAGAAAVDLGAASSHPDAARVDAAVEISRLRPVLPALVSEGIPVSVDSFEPDVQRFALREGAAMLNDIHGFPDPGFYPELAKSQAMLIVMHCVQAAGIATREDVPARDILARIYAFFDARIEALRQHVPADRLILDPGLGFFLGRDPECSFTVLRALPELKKRYGLPVLISASRKSFLGAVTNRAVHERSAATLACELEARRLGCDWIRTHDVRALVDGSSVQDLFNPPRAD